MTDLEILGELKRMYYWLEDILENAEDDQIEDDDYTKLEKVETILENQYRKIYKRIEKEEKKLLCYQKDIMVADEIYNDYVTCSKDYDDQYLTYADVDEKKWWEDEEFLTKMQEENVMFKLYGKDELDVEKTINEYKEYALYLKKYVVG